MRGGPSMRGGANMRGAGNMRGGGMRGARSNNGFNDLVSYPLRGPGGFSASGFGAVRQEKIQQRFNPLSFGGGMPNNGYAAF